MTRYRTLEDVIGEYVTVKAYTEKSIWAECDVLVRAHDDGFRIDDIKGEIAHAARCSARLIWDRYKVGRVFPPERRDLSLSPEIHRLCASVVDLRAANPDFEAAYAWLETAGREAYSTRQLAAAIRAAGGNPDAGKPVYLLDNVEATVVSFAYGDSFITLQTAILPPLTCGMRVLLTLVQAPAEETEVSR